MAAQDNFLKSRGSEMSLARAARAHQEQTVLARERELPGEAPNDEFCLHETVVPGLELFARSLLDLVVRLEILEIAVAVALGNTSLCEEPLGAVAHGAVAGHGPDHRVFAGSRFRRR